MPCRRKWVWHDKLHACTPSARCKHSEEPMAATIYWPIRPTQKNVLFQGTTLRVTMRRLWMRVLSFTLSMRLKRGGVVQYWAISTWCLPRQTAVVTRSRALEGVRHSNRSYQYSRWCATHTWPEAARSKRLFYDLIKQEATPHSLLAVYIVALFFRKTSHLASYIDCSTPHPGS